MIVVRGWSWRGKLISVDSTQIYIYIYTNDGNVVRGITIIVVAAVIIILKKRTMTM